MAGLFITDEQIAHARSLARDITNPIFDTIARNTTVSVERTVLRWFGVDGVGNLGAPLVNLMVDRLKAAGVLNKGAAYWYGRALRMGASSPLDAVERLTTAPLETLGPLSVEEEAKLRAEVRAEAQAMVTELKDRVAKRNALKDEFPMGQAPHKYLIVATGNIFDDVDQARAAAQAGADVIAVIRSTAQSLLDYVPHGATTEGYGGTYATQENFRIMREALDDESRRLKRYVQLTNYSSGLCMSEIAFCAAWERLDMLLNDAMYGILFRDINMRRTFIDQYFSRRICALAGVIINTGEDNYITTADAYDAAHTVIASQFINECFAHRAGVQDWQLGLGHSYEIDPHRPETLLLELSQAMLVRRCFHAAHQAQGDRHLLQPRLRRDGRPGGDLDAAGHSAAWHDDRSHAHPAARRSVRGPQERQLPAPGRPRHRRGVHRSRRREDRQPRALRVRQGDRAARGVPQGRHGGGDRPGPFWRRQA
jgi:beta-lysine 5,6-aminomutase alpha subunit